MKNVEDSIQSQANEISRMGVHGLLAAATILLATRSWLTRSVLLLALILSTVAVVAPISRSGVLAATLGSIVVWKLAGRNLTWLAVLTGIAFLMLSVAYPPFFTRMTMPTLGGERDARRDVLLKYLETSPSTVVFGTGSGNYSASWGLAKGFPVVRATGQPLGMHNCYVQSALSWGVPATGLYFIYTVSIMLAPFRLQKGCAAKPFITGLAASYFITVMLAHDFGSKLTVVSMGLLIATYCWRDEWSGTENTDLARWSR